MKNYEIITYKDGQVTAKVDGVGDVHIEIRGNSYSDLFSAASLKEAWDEINKLNPTAVATLTIHCLIGQRSDRRFNQGESFDLKVIANFINAMNFHKVNIFHPHSDISLALINKSEKISHLSYVKKTLDSIGNAILISPDAGAYKSTYHIAVELETELIAANKVRIDGNPKVTVQGNVKNQNCLIVDDLADGGRTFKILAEELKLLGASHVYLYVSHGQFNHGFDELGTCIDHIYCTNSYRDIDHPMVTQFMVI